MQYPFDPYLMKSVIPMENNMKNTENKINKIDANTHFRVSVFRSNKSISAQIIDDSKGITVANATSIGIKEKLTPIKIAEHVGEKLAKEAKERKISKVIFDRNSYRYHGRVKALAEGMRSVGIKF